jgi:hypothetical protein
LTDRQQPGETQYQHLWFALARRDWASLVMVPADQGESTDEVALRLAEVGKQLSGGPVTAITVKSLAYGTAVALADLPSFVDRARQSPSAVSPIFEMPPSELDHRDQAGEWTPAGGSGEEPIRNDQAMQTVPSQGEGGSMVASGARLIISIPPVVAEPLGLATAHNADLVVVCLELGRTRLASARRTLDLIGRDRVAGCFLIHG